MLPKRLLLGTLLLTAMLIVAGCATTGESRDDFLVRYRIAKDECIRFGHRRCTYDYNRCMERILKSAQNTPAEVN